MPISLALDFRRADLRTRERFHLRDDDIGGIYREPRRGALREMVIVATCNRVEIYGASDGNGRTADHAGILAELARRWMPDDVGRRELLAGAVVRDGEAAAAHLLRVAAGLESQLLGDGQILGQLRGAYRRAADAGAVGPTLHRVFHAALRTGKRVQVETGLVGARNTVGSEAAMVADRQVGPVGLRRCVVVGCGKTGEQAARRLAKLGAGDVVLINRTPRRAAELAASLGARVAGYDTLHQELSHADVGVIATGADLPTVRASSLAWCRSQAGTTSRALLLIDLAMPRNVEPEAGGLEGVTLLDLDALHPPLAAAEAERRAAVPRAERIVAAEMERLRAWLKSAPARDAIHPLREAIGEVVRREAAFAAGGDAAERITERVLAKVLARPMKAMRAAAERGEPVDAYAEAIRVLFGDADALAGGLPDQRAEAEPGSMREAS
jgi:glutamyl-tRNA reductase